MNQDKEIIKKCGKCKYQYICNGTKREYRLLCRDFAPAARSTYYRWTEMSYYRYASKTSARRLRGGE